MPPDTPPAVPGKPAVAVDVCVRLPLGQIARLTPEQSRTLLEGVGRVLATEAEAAHLRERIALTGGYHERTAREIEIARALEQIPPSERDPADVALAELLLLVDAGRSRVHEEIELREAAEAEVARLRAENERLQRQLDYFNVEPRNHHDP
jgi:hypothetical protein